MATARSWSAVVRKTASAVPAREAGKASDAQTGYDPAPPNPATIEAHASKETGLFCASAIHLGKGKGKAIKPLIN